MRPENLKLVIFDLVKVDGIYERDLLHKLVNRYTHKSIEDTVQFLIERRYIKRAGDKIRPILVRMESARVVYQNLRPVAQGTEQILLKMHSNFEENRP